MGSIGKLIGKAVAKRKAMKPAAKPKALGVKSRGVMGGIKAAAGKMAKPAPRTAAKPARPARPAMKRPMGRGGR